MLGEKQDAVWIVASVILAVLLGRVLRIDFETIDNLPIVIPIGLMVITTFVWMFDPYIHHHKNPTTRTAMIHFSKWFNLLAWFLLISFGVIRNLEFTLFGLAFEDLVFYGVVGSLMICMLLFFFYWVVPVTSQQDECSSV